MSSGPMMRMIEEALLDAFPTNAELSRMVQYGLEMNLAQIASESGLAAVVFELLQWAQAHGRIEALVAAARVANPTNSKLAAVAIEFEHAGRTKPPSELGVSDEERSVHDEQLGLEYMSTGAATEYVGLLLSREISTGVYNSMDDIEAECKRQAVLLRGVELDGRHLLKLGKSYPLEEWDGKDPKSRQALATYLREYCEWIKNANHYVGQHLAMLLRTRAFRTVIVGEYSRAIFSGLAQLRQPTSLEVLLINRKETAQQPYEFPRAFTKLTQIGVAVRWLAMDEWRKFLKNDKLSEQSVVLFGAEAVGADGSVLYPQVLKEDEIDLLKRWARRGKREAWCVAEMYKILPPEAHESLVTTARGGRYSMLPGMLFKRLVTDSNRVVTLAREAKGTVKTDSFRAEVRERTRVMLSTAFENCRPRALDMMPDADLKDVRAIVADIDGTITDESGRFDSQVLADFRRLTEEDIAVVLCTGRSAGWAQALATYLPNVACVVAENGNVAYGAKELPLPALSGAFGERQRKQLAHAAGIAEAEWHLERTQDSVFRLTEVTFFRPSEWGVARTLELSQKLGSDIEVLASAIHIHVRLPLQNKSGGVIIALQSLKGWTHEEIVGRTLAVGDSGNDRPLFEMFRRRSVGVANVRQFLPELGEGVPTYIAKNEGAMGFNEIVERILAARSPK